MSNLEVQLYREGLVKSGLFKLKSGLMSPFYVDCKGIPQHPGILRSVTKSLVTQLIDTGAKWVCGVPDGGVPFACAASYESGIPLLLVRKQQKSHGINELVANGYSSGDKVFVIEDVVTTGQSLREFCTILERCGLVIAKTVCLVNRGTEPLPEPIIPLRFVNGSPAPSNPLLPRLDKKIIWAADCETMDELLEKLDEFGPHISVVKTHIDALPDVTPTKIALLRQKKEVHRILVWEDRKFADIGFVMDQQIRNNGLAYRDWVDLFSIHCIAGESSLRSVFRNNPEFKWVLIGEMSSEGNLIDEDYTSKVLDIARRNSDVVAGVVCQKDIGAEFVRIVPGVSSVETTDSMGQVYSTYASKTFADFIVVGRSIADFVPSRGKGDVSDSNRT